MKKSIISAFIAACIFVLLAFSASAVTVDESKLRITGDVDGNGKITVDDARACLRAVVQLDKLSKEQLILADMDGKNGVDVNDARAILRIAAKLDRKIPEGHVHEYMDGLGTDPTCTEPGYCQYWCKGCENTFYTFTKAFGHDLDSTGKCSRCGNTYTITVLDGITSVKAKVGGTIIVRLAAQSEEEDTFTVKSRSDCVSVGLSESTYDTGYYFLFITVNKGGFKDAKVDICYDDIPSVSTSITVNVDNSAASSVGAVGITAPDIGTYFGTAPVSVGAFDDSDDCLAGFAFSYELKPQKFVYYSGLVDSAMSSNGFAYAKTESQTINGVLYSIKTFVNNTTGIAADVGFALGSDGVTVSGVAYAFSAMR